MRICHIVTSLHLGGAEVLLAHTCNEQARSHEVTVIYLKPIATVAPLFQPSVKLIGCHRRRLRGLRALLQQEAPDIVHTHLPHGDWYGLRTARCHSALFCTLHGTRFHQPVAKRIGNTLYRFLFRRLVPHCRVICISEAVRQYALTSLGADAAKTTVVPNAIPPLAAGLTRSEARRRLGLSNDAFVVLFVGRLEEEKAIPVLLEAAAKAWSQISTLRLEIVGTGSQLRSLQEQARQLSLTDRVRFRGATLHPSHHYRAADVFVLPSRNEGFGVVILEAFQAGLPVLASDIEGPRELVQNGVNGHRFPVGDAAELARQLVNLFVDAGERGRLADGARRSFTDVYSITRYAERIEGLYQQRLSEVAEREPSMKPALNSLRQGWRPSSPFSRLWSRLGAVTLGGLCGQFMRARAQNIPELTNAGLLVVAPHPDDETLGCGGLIALKRRLGARVAVAFITDGAGSHPGHPQFAPAALREMRRREALDALAVLGVESNAVTFLDVPDGSLAPKQSHAALVVQVGELIRREQPGVITVTFRQDLHPDHEASFRIVSEAASQVAPQVPVVEYPVWSLWYLQSQALSRLLGLRLHKIRVAPVLELKRRALSCHRSQVEPLPPWTRGQLPARMIRRHLQGWELFACNPGTLPRF